MTWRKLSSRMMTRKLITFSALLVVAASLVSAQAIAPAKTPAPATSIAPMKVGGDVLPPKLIHSVEPKAPHFALFHKHGTNLVLVGLTVSTGGIPDNVHIVKSGGTSFDKASLDAVKQYRFQPATLHGKPVPVNQRPVSILLVNKHRKRCTNFHRP